LLIGSTIFLIGFIEMAVAAHLMQYPWFMLGMVLFAIGWGFVRPCAILSALNSVPPSHKSMASGMISTMRQLGAALGFALVYAAISTYQHAALLKIIKQQHLTITVQKLNSLITHTQTNPAFIHLIPAIKTAHTQALVLGLAVASVLALAKLILVIIGIPSRKRI